MNSPRCSISSSPHAGAERRAARRLPPILAFQSVVDSTVAGEALFSTLFAQAPANGSEIVLFDVNRATPLELLMSRDALQRLEQMLPTGPQTYRITVMGNSPGALARHRKQRARRAPRHHEDACARPRISARLLLAVARGAAVSPQRFAVRHRAG